MEDAKKTLNVKNLYFFYFLTLVILPFGFLIRLLYSNTINSEEFGIIYSLIAFMSVLFFFSNLGLSTALKHFIPKFKVRKDYQKISNLYWYTLIIQFFLVTLISVLLFNLSSFLTSYYFDNALVENYLSIFIFYFIGLTLFRNLLDMYLAYGIGIYNRFMGFFQMSLILFSSILFFLLNLENLSYYYSLSWVIGTFGTGILFLIILFIKIPYLFRIPKFDLSLLKEFISYSFYVLFSSLGTLFLNKLDIIIITYFLSVTSVAYYSNAFALVELLGGLFGILAMVMFPIFSELKEKKDFKTLNTILNTLYGIIFFLILPISLTFFLFPDEFLKTLFGEEYMAGASVLALFSLFSIFKIFSTYNMAFANGLGRAKTLSKIILPIALLNIVLNIILIQYFNILGVAIATVIGWILISTLTYRIISKETHFKLDIKKLTKIFFLAVMFVALVLTLKQFISIINDYITITFILAFSFAIYLILGYLLKIYTINDLYIFIPSKKLKQTLKTYHKKYLPTLK